MAVRWGVIGAGGIADRRTIPEGLVPSDRCELVAVMDVDEWRARTVADKYGVPVWTTQIDDVLSRPDVEAVYIATPVYLHKDQVIAAAWAGKHVLVEKPMAMTLTDGEEMLSVCSAQGVKFAAGYMMRFHAHHQRLRQMIDEGVLGQVVFGRAQLTCWYPEIPGAWRQDPALGGGGAFMDMGTHCLDLLEMLIGPVKRVAAFMSTLTFGYAVEDTATVLVEFENGAQGVVDVSFNVPDDAAQNVLEIRGTKGLVLADHTVGQDAGGHMIAYLPQDIVGYDASQVREGGSIAKPVEVNPVNMYRAEVEHFVDCIERDVQPVVGGAEALHALRLTLAVYEAARTGCVAAL
ncbi:MAG: Gfo/Idh/MocA family oxidoreductase [Chloroflexi bacterium]|nr:Gfo/Idh/MocA family oxidoreductase [Chloroflexota bacterium]